MIKSHCDVCGKEIKDELVFRDNKLGLLRHIIVDTNPMDICRKCLIKELITNWRKNGKSKNRHLEASKN